MIIEFFIYSPEPGSNLKFPSESLKDKRKLRVKALLLCLFLIQPRTASQIVQGNYPRQKTKSQVWFQKIFFLSFRLSRYKIHQKNNFSHVLMHGYLQQKLKYPACGSWWSLSFNNASQKTHRPTSFTHPSTKFEGLGRKSGKLYFSGKFQGKLFIPSSILSQM